MMIRDGRRQEHNVGPTPYTRERGPVPGGVLVTARRAKPAPAPRPVSPPTVVAAAFLP